MYRCFWEKESNCLNTEQTLSWKGYLPCLDSLFLLWLHKYIFSPSNGKIVPVFQNLSLKEMLWYFCCSFGLFSIAFGVWSVCCWWGFFVWFVCLFFFLQNQVKNVNEVTGVRTHFSLCLFSPFCSLVVVKRICLHIPMALFSVQFFHLCSQPCYLSSHLFSPWDHALH